MHGVSGSTSSSDDPAMHAGHVPVNPLSETSVPRSHRTHGVAESRSRSVEPGEQTYPEHGPLLPAAAKWPIGHATHGVLAFRSWSTEPAAQGPHAPNERVGE